MNNPNTEINNSITDNYPHIESDYSSYYQSTLAQTYNNNEEIMDYPNETLSDYIEWTNEPKNDNNDDCINNEANIPNSNHKKNGSKK